MYRESHSPKIHISTIRYMWYDARTALYGLPEADRAPEEMERLKWWLIYACVATGVTVNIAILIL